MLKFLNRNVMIMIVITIGIIIGTVACTPEAQENTSVVLQLNWIHDAAFVGFFMANDLDYYAENGIEVEIKEVFDANGNLIDVVDEIVSGRAQFGVVDTATLLKAHAAGSSVMAIGTIFQRHPLAILSLAENNILAPEDLVGKTAHISGNSIVMFTALLESRGIDPTDVNIVERTDFSSTPITSGEADVIDAWVINEVPFFVVEDIAFNAIYPFEYGIDMYPDLIITSEDLIADNPELVQNFLDATLRGIQVTIDDTPVAVEHVLTWMPDGTSSEEITEALSRAIPLLVPSRSSPGLMTPELWTVGHDILLEAGVLEEALNLEEVYTMQFLDAIYASDD